MADQPTASIDSPAQYVFVPPPGGDISFRSADGKVFCLHTIILKLASTVFSDMFTVGTQSTEVVDLADDSESISLMLGFIYPSTMPPLVNTFMLLEKSLQIAQKYHVETMLQKIDRALCQETSYKRFIESDPLRLFQLCVTYELRETQTAVAKLFRPALHGLAGPKSLVTLAKQYPGSAHVIGLLGAQLARENILRSLLLDLTNLSIFIFVKEEYVAALSCQVCQAQSKKDAGTDVDMELELVLHRPGWFHRWGSLVHHHLTTSTGDADSCSWLFSLGVLPKLGPPHVYGPICWACVDTAYNAEGGRVFESWAKDAKEFLQRELDKLDVLYSL
ncbi:hypothetical protein BDV93DRAFT_554240 [Ceratobasidium sp. AG-I]|nr:hypothetical protein BDV93DRAFT_554240 [Ceratobasidium sp. AG-I]